MSPILRPSTPGRGRVPESSVAARLFVAEIIQVQAAEIASMQAWLKKRGR